jgi:pyridoxine 4-dehydrogenase
VAARPCAELLVIAGTSSLAHLEENVAVGDLELTPEDIAALDAN